MKRVDCRSYANSLWLTRFLLLTGYFLSGTLLDAEDPLWWYLRNRNDTQTLMLIPVSVRYFISDLTYNYLCTQCHCTVWYKNIVFMMLISKYYFMRPMSLHCMTQKINIFLVDSSRRYSILWFYLQNFIWFLSAILWFYHQNFIRFLSATYVLNRCSFGCNLFALFLRIPNDLVDDAFVSWFSNFPKIQWRRD